MAIFRNTAESTASTGTTVDTTNSATPNAWTSLTIGTGCTVTYDNAVTMKGAKNIKFASATGQTNYAEWLGITGGSTAGAAVRFYFYMPAFAATTDQNILGIRTTGSGTALAGLRINHTTGALIAYSDAASTALGTTTGTLSANTLYRIEVAMTNPSTTTGTYTLRVYAGDSTTAISNMSLDLTAVNLGSSAAGTFRFGRVGVLNDTWTIYMDDIAAQTGSATLIGPSVTNVAPTGTAPANATGAVGTPVTLTGTDSDPDGTVVTRAWTMTGTPPGVTAPALSNAATAAVTFTPAAAGRYILSYLVTDDQGATSTPSTVKVFVPTTTVSVIEVTSNPGVWTNVGGAADLATAANDGSDTTYAQSPAAPGSAALLRYRLAPLSTPTTFSLTVRTSCPLLVAVPLR
jgi:hypothetical protein